MRVLPFTIPKPISTAVMYQRDSGSLYNQLHQHEEVQISWIETGEGTLFAGDTIHAYKADVLLVIGGQQPHVFREINSPALMHSIFFSPRTFGQVFLDLEEGKGIEEFYTFAKAGLKTFATPQIKTIFKGIARHQGIERLSCFLTLLSQLRKVPVTPLSTFIYKRQISETDGKRMNAILDYTMQTYTTSVSLLEASAAAAMTPNAFCKYFKQRTNKTYFEFVNELRIEKSCYLLCNDVETPINQIAILCGYQTLSHFNKKFKALKGVVPRLYRMHNAL